MATHDARRGVLGPQQRKERLRSTRRRAGVHALIATLTILGGVLVGCSPDTGAQSEDPGSGAASTAPVSPSTPPNSDAVLETLDTDFDAKYRITMHLLDGYTQAGGNPVVFGTDDGQGISAWTVGNVYADPCHSAGTLLLPPIGPSVGGLVAGLASQKNHPSSEATDVTLDGFSGKYMELTVPAGVHLADCDAGEFRTWTHTMGGQRSLEPGQRDLLWIVDVDGTRLVIDAALGSETTQQDRADRIHMVESIRIEPV
jgi:hypothetical protein